MKELEALRSYRWDGDTYGNKLEETLMKVHARKPMVLAHSWALLAALALVLIGAAATAAVYEWNGMTIISTPLDDGSTRIEIHKDGDKVVDEIVQPDEGAMVTDDGELIVVVPEEDARKDER